MQEGLTRFMMILKPQASRVWGFLASLSGYGSGATVVQLEINPKPLTREGLEPWSRYKSFIISQGYYNDRSIIKDTTMIDLTSITTWILLQVCIMIISMIYIYRYISCVYYHNLKVNQA